MERFSWALVADADVVRRSTRTVRILPKKHFTWREPKPFLTVLDEHERSNRRWWHQPLFVLIICAFTMLSWYLAHFNPTKHPPSFPAALLLSLALGVFLAYFMPWLTGRLPSQITVFDRHIIRSRGQTQHIRFADLTSFAWRSAPEFSTLVFTHRRGRQIFVGVPNDIPSDSLSAFLSERLSPNEPNA